MDQGVSTRTGCPRCAEPVYADDLFCEACGERLEPERAVRPQAPAVAPQGFIRAPTVTPRGGITPEASAHCYGCGCPAIDDDGYCRECGLGQPAPRDRMVHDLWGVVAGISDKGRVRSTNADAMAFGYDGREATQVVAVVCDGVGSGEGADQAAQAAADAAVAELLACLADGLPPRQASVTAAAIANTAAARIAGTDSPSTTYLSAVVSGNEVTVSWIGDSRAYWVAGGPAATVPAADGDRVTGTTCLTVDHTVRNAHLADGTRAANTLTRWIGTDAPDTTPQVTTVVPAGAGTVVLCTDGLWGYLEAPAAFGAAARAYVSPADMTAGLVDFAIASGGRDNITAVAIPFPAAGRWP